MGELHRLDCGGSPPLAAASAVYLATLSGPEQRNTQRAYRSTLRALAAELAPPGTAFTVAELDDEDNVDRLTQWFTARWSGRAAATFNRHLDALRSAASFWIRQGWLTADPARRLRRRGRAPDRTRALGAAEVEALLDMDVPIRDTSGGRGGGPGAGGAVGSWRAGEREQVLVSAWLTGLRSARTEIDFRPHPGRPRVSPRPGQADRRRGRHRRCDARRGAAPARPGAEPARHRRPARHRHRQEERPAPLTRDRDGMLREHDEKTAAAAAVG